MSVRISGDTLALDKQLRRLIEQQTAAIRQRFPNRTVEVAARIAEEFDPLHGHRVRCELVAAADGQQIVLREAHKKPEDAIKAAFAGLKSQLRRLRLKHLGKLMTAPDLRATGT